MRKIRTTLGFFLFLLPLAIHAQYFAFEMGVTAGPGYALKPNYFRNFFRSSGVYGARLILVLTERSCAEFDFGTTSFRCNTDKFAAALGAPAASGTAASGGRIRLDISTLSYQRYLIPAESGMGVYALAGFGLDYIVTEPIRVTTLAAGPEPPSEQFIETVDAGYFLSLCGGLGLSSALFERVTLFLEARIHYSFSDAGRDIITGSRVKDFTEYWIPTIGLKYGF